MENIIEGRYQLNNELPEDVQELIGSLLQTRSRLRPDIATVLNSLWVTRFHNKDKPINKFKPVLRKESAPLEDYKRMLDAQDSLKRQVTEADVMDEASQAYQIHNFLEEDSDIEETLIESIKSSYISCEDEVEEVPREIIYDYPLIEIKNKEDGKKIGTVRAAVLSSIENKNY